MLMAAEQKADELPKTDGNSQLSFVAINPTQSFSAHIFDEEQIEKDAKLFINQGLRAILNGDPVSSEVIDWFKMNSSNQEYITTVIERLYPEETNNKESLVIIMKILVSITSIIL